MMAILSFIFALVWGTLSAQFFLQFIVSLSTLTIHVSAFLFSKVDKRNNSAGCIALLTQTIIFAVLFFGGNWLYGMIIDYGTWNATSIASLALFLLTLICMLPQIPGKILLAWKCAWIPYFFEASNAMPPHERIAFAKNYKQTVK